MRRPKWIHLSLVVHPRRISCLLTKPFASAVSLAFRLSFSQVCLASPIEEWLQHHPETGSSWPSWPQASYLASRASSVGIRAHNL